MLDNKEYQLLIKKGYVFSDSKPTKKTNISSLFVFVSDTRRLHDSGFPFIRIFGEIQSQQLIDLGWHDHFLVYKKVNIDAYGKNLLHIMSWCDKIEGFWISGNNYWCSTFEIREDGELR